MAATEERSGLGGDALPTVLSGIGLAVVGFMLFSVHDALVKWVVTSISIWQILFFRSLTIVIGCLAVGRREIVVRTIETPYRVPLLIRAGLLLLAWICYFSASADLQLAELTTIYFGSPVLVTLLAIPILGERVSGRQWVAVAVGFVGVVIACRPTSGSFGTATLLALAASAIWACAIILMRRTSLGAGTFMQIFVVNLVFLPVVGVGTWLTWTTPSWPTLGMLITIGVIGGLAQMTAFEGIRRAPASVLAPFEYTALIWSFVLGYLVWGDVPGVPVFAGAAMIMASGILAVSAVRARIGR